MREITCEQIASAVEELCLEACIRLPEGMCRAITAAKESETCPLGRDLLADIEKNYILAREKDLPICQDTGMAVVFLELGQEVHITGGLLRDAVNEGVRRAYVGNLRCSVVADPLQRVNTGDNTPAVLHLELVEGDGLRITVAPKGFGSENMSRMMMFTPSATRQDIIDFVTETVTLAGSNPCPPMVLGVGIGGTIEDCALAAKTALLREPGSPGVDEYYQALEEDMLAAVNATGVGPQGVGGKATALAVFCAPRPTHIAGLPCVVNVSCHATRHAVKRL